jgi:hypothetical protein
MDRPRLKLRLDDVQIESFPVAEAGEEHGTVQGNMLATAVGGTCRGQTVLCTQCGNQNCGA